MLDKAATSCLTPADVKRLHFEPFQEEHELPIYPKWSGFKIPYFKLDGSLDPGFFRFRFTQTKPSTGFAAIADEPVKPKRYAQPSREVTSTACGVYLPPITGGTWADIAKDPAFSLIITEGELKAACACKFGFHTIGLGGVYNWRSAKDNQELLPILEEFVWLGRKVTICFDSDASTNPMVWMAASRLAYILAMRGAVVVWAQLPGTEADNTKQGVDDYIFANGAEAFATLLTTEIRDLGPGKELHRLNSEVVFIKSTSEVVEMETGNVYSPSAFTEARYRNRSYSEQNDKGQLVKKFAAKEWLAWEHRTEIKRLAYDPACNNAITEDAEYNTWYPQRWPIQPSTKGTIQPWLTLFDYIMDGLSKEDKLWAKRWFACPIQVPGTKLATAILVWGRQTGTGKTLLGETMKYVYGRNYGKITNNDLSNNFNEWAVDKQFIVGDEISIGDKRSLANALKDMITRNELRVNIKNRKTYPITDCINYFFTSNHEDAIYIEAHDRRLFVHEVATMTPMAPKEYKAYVRWLEREGGAARLFHYLKYEVELGDFDPKGRAPLTSAKLEMSASGRGDTEDWAISLATNPDLILPPEKFPYDLYTVEDLLKVYDPEDRQKTRSVGLGRALNAAGIFKVASGSNNIIIEGTRRRLYAIRNIHKYKITSPTAARKMYEAERPNFGKGIGGSGKFAAGNNTGRLQ